jgi:hypothetical protein
MGSRDHSLGKLDMMQKYLYASITALFILLPPILGLELCYRVISWLRRNRRS